MPILVLKLPAEIALPPLYFLLWLYKKTGSWNWFSVRLAEQICRLYGFPDNDLVIFVFVCYREQLAKKSLRTVKQTADFLFAVKKICKSKSYKKYRQEKEKLGEKVYRWKQFR